MTREEVLEKVRAYVGDDTSDAAIGLIEAVSEYASDEWETKYNELDQRWRKRYRERFFTGETTEEPEEVEEVEEKTYTYNDLFKEEK